MRALLFVPLLAGCHALLHSTDPLHEQISDIVAIHNQHTDYAWGNTSAAQLTTPGATYKDSLSGLLLHRSTHLGIKGVLGDKLCFSTSWDESAVNGEAAARASAKSRFESHYAYFFFKDTNEVNAKVVHPTYATSQPFIVTTDGDDVVEGEKYVDKDLEERQMQDSIFVEVQLCGEVPKIPEGAKWFAVTLLYPYDKEEKNSAALFQIWEDDQPEAPEEEPAPE